VTADKDRDGVDMFSKKRHFPRLRRQDSRLSQDRRDKPCLETLSRQDTSQDSITG